MNRRLDKRSSGKLMRVVGIGGIYCPCCTLGKKSTTKKFWNRLDRRRTHRELLHVIEEEVL